MACASWRLTGPAAAAERTNERTVPRERERSTRGEYRARRRHDRGRERRRERTRRRGTQWTGGGPGVDDAHQKFIIHSSSRVSKN
ncbi:uncharacterized protein MICPUCDRAFT_66563 [Micromonas pusilla CCMP1545]|uniref:Predicted protein n=1 Tax=Micromonas pusilla (strain CCMP1545) TaxID=564608 RepID=C1N930_MICPC|nr:uncharacterized protein MICPUCDRAFT_66563 [Micromonas pusilla CCMP1545]EEH51288.1 predicted protein [Micromonas pusilla CCMP1545]|eukprot:XP_003064383.1 predicted protein [Micromonas pusilla CCMP1545]